MKHQTSDLGMEFTDDRLLRAGELALRLGVSRAKVYRLMQDGTLPTIRIGGSVRVPARDLEDWLNSQKRPALSLSPSGFARRGPTHRDKEV
jgi:excisionase family DNA binding protein